MDWLTRLIMGASPAPVSNLYAPDPRGRMPAQMAPQMAPRPVNPDRAAQNLAILGKLYQSRMRAANRPEVQDQLGPLEHGAFTHAAVYDNPLMAIPLVAATPFWTAKKALGNTIRGGRKTPTSSAPSLDEIMASYFGVYDGLRDRFSGR